MLSLTIRSISIALILGAVCSAQVIAKKLSDSLHAAGSTDKAVFGPEEDIPISLRLADPAPRALSVTGKTVCGGEWLMFSGTAKAHDTLIELHGRVSHVAVDGKCSIDTFEIEAPTQSDNKKIITPTELRLPAPITFEIIGIPRVSEVISGPVQATVELSERQYLRSRSLPLKDQRDSAFLRLDKNARPSRDLDTYLLQVLTSARESLEMTRSEITSRYHPPDGAPVFFEDLDRRYYALIIDIRRDLKQMTSSSAAQMSLIAVQTLKSRPNASSTDGLPRLSGTLPPIAYEAIDLLDWNIAVYREVSELGQQTFDISLVSLPSDANVEAKRIGEDYNMLGSKTTVARVTFPFAVWTFRFSKTGCKDHVQRFDPIRDASDNISVELNCGK